MDDPVPTGCDRHRHYRPQFGIGLGQTAPLAIDFPYGWMGSSPLKVGGRWASPLIDGLQKVPESRGFTINRTQVEVGTTNVHLKGRISEAGKLAPIFCRAAIGMSDSTSTRKWGQFSEKAPFGVLPGTFNNPL